MYKWCFIVIIALCSTAEARKPRPGGRCKEDADCTKPNTECVENYCKPTVCSSDGDCTDGAVCLSKGDTSYCLLPPRGYCTDDATCTAINGNLQCVDNFCKPTNCSDSSDCVDGAVCFDKGDGSYCFPRPRGYCTDDANCTAISENLQCVDNFCKPINCTDNSDCVDGAVCFDKGNASYCFPPPKGYCTEDANCTSANFECLDNFCKPITCSSDGDCVDGFVCKTLRDGSMRCMPPQCDSDADCAMGERCVKTRKGNFCKTIRTKN